MDEKIAYIKYTRESVMNAANVIINRRMKEYAEKFGWDPKIDPWLWNGMGDCGTEYLVAIGNSMNTSDRAGKEITKTFDMANETINRYDYE